MDKKKKIIMYFVVAFVVGIIIYLIMKNKKASEVAIPEEPIKSDKSIGKYNPVTKKDNPIYLSEGDSVIANKGGATLLDLNYKKARTIIPGSFAGRIKEISKNKSLYKVMDTAGNSFWVLSNSVEKI